MLRPWLPCLLRSLKVEACPLLWEYFPSSEFSSVCDFKTVSDLPLPSRCSTASFAAIPMASHNESNVMVTADHAEPVVPPLLPGPKAPLQPYSPWNLTAFAHILGVCVWNLFYCPCASVSNLGVCSGTLNSYFRRDF